MKGESVKAPLIATRKRRLTMIKISTDSTADIPKHLCEELDISVIPLTVLANGKEYRDGVDITPQEFYRILDESDEIPVSSQVSVTLYSELFEKTYSEGFDNLIHVSINSKGSGTYQAGLIAKDLFYEKHPEAEGRFNIHLIDSRTYSMTYGIPVVEAAKMVKDGADTESVLAHINDWVEHSRPMFVPLTLKFVKKSGRISAAAAFVGDAIGLKPLITFEDGEAVIVSKARGEKKAVAELIATCLKERRPGTNYCIVYGKNEEIYQKVKEECQKVMDQPPLIDYNVGCIISINTGPDMIGIIYRT